MFNMDAAQKHGLMDQLLKVTMLMGKSTDKALTNGQMARRLLEVGQTIKLMVMVFTCGLTVESLKETGKTITCMDRESTVGQTVDVMKVNMKMTKNMVEALTHGVMVVSTMVNGQMASSTGRVSIDMLMATVKQEYGRKANAQCGPIIEFS